MRSWLRNFWLDEAGAVLSAELVTVGTVAVLGTTVGLSTVATAVNEEMTDLARAIRSLDQSYSFRGFSSCRAYTAGSCYTQQPVNESILALCAGTAPTAVQPGVSPGTPMPTTVVPEAAVPGEVAVDAAPQPPTEDAVPGEEAVPAGEKLTN